MHVAQWSVRNRVAVNILMAALLLAGFFTAATRLPRDLFPDVSTNFIQITTIDPTTSTPEDIEQLITIPIEEEVGSARGLINLSAFSQSNVSSIFLEIDSRIDNLDPIVSEVRQHVSRARPLLPASAEEPLVEEFEIPFPLITFGVSFPPGFDSFSMRESLDRLERELRSLTGVSRVLVDGLDNREIWVEVDPFLAEAHRLTLGEVSQSITRRQQNWVGGRLEGAGGERTIRLLGEISAVEDLETQPIAKRNEHVVLLRDIATVKDRTEKEQTRGRVNMKDAVTYTIIKQRGADALATAQAAQSVFERARQVFPAEVEAMVLSDSTKYIDVRIQTVLQNGYQALVIVVMLLLILLDWRLAVLIAIGLPVAFAGTFLVLDWMGQSVNLLSLFAMIMALGIIVDNALVIAENIYRYYENGESRVTAAVKGAKEVTLPVLGSFSTTVAAFLPLMLGTGILGKFLVIIPIVVISALCFSLVQAFVILPCHLADFVRHPSRIRDLEARRSREQRLPGRAYFTAALIYTDMRRSVDSFLKGVIDVYVYFLTECLRRRYAVVGMFLFLFVGAITLVASGVLGFQLFKADFADRIFVKMELPSNYSLDQTEKLVAQVEADIVNRLPADELVALVTRIGGSLDPTNQFLHYGSNLAMITVDIDEQNPATRSPSVIERDLRRVLADYPQFINTVAEAEGGGPPVGRAINVRIAGPEFDSLQEIAAEMERRLAEVPGVMNLGNDFERSKPEIRLRVDEEKAAYYNLDVADVGRFIQGAYRGLEAARSRRGNEEVRIRVLFDERWQRDPELLGTFKVINRLGNAVALEAVTEFSQTSGFGRINRRNQQRVITVSGDVDTRQLTSRQINRTIESWLDEFYERYPEYRFDLEGENEDTERSIESMKYAALLAFLLIYVILAVIFNSFIQPLVIMSVIPFGVVGVVAGLMFMGEPLGLMAIMGTIALAGIVVNNSVVFVDFINNRRRLAMGEDNPNGSLYHSSPHVRWYSIIHSGKIRFRPIMLTTLTTIGGLANLAFLTTGQEQFLAPMAQSIIFGLIFASLITMILIPCLYSITDDMKAFFLRRKGRSGARE